MSRQVALLFPSFRGGGMERVFVNLANGFSTRGYDVRIFVLSDEGPLKGEVDSSRVFSLGASRASRALPELLRVLREHTEWPFIVGPGHVNVIAGMANRIAPVRRLILTEHTHVSQSRVCNPSMYNRVRPALIRIAYGGSDLVVGVSREVCDDLSRYTAMERACVYNPIVRPEIFEMAREPVLHQWFEGGFQPLVAVGRLDPSKGFDVLLRALARLQRHPRARLAIFGEGHLRPQLEKLVLELSLSARVWMPGFVPNPFAYIKKATALVSASRWEGLGTVLIEGLALGVPVVSTRYIAGANEILKGGRYGLLSRVDDVEGLAGNLDRVLDSSYSAPVVPREHLDQFTLEVVLDRYAELIE